MFKNGLKIEAAQQKKRVVKFAILVGGLGNAGECEFIDFVTAKHMTKGLPRGSRSEKTAVVSSAEFFCRGSSVYFLKFPCLCDEGSIDGRTLARIAKEIRNMATNVEVSSFFYLVNHSQLPRGLEVHELHLQSWSQIFGVPPEPEAPKFLVTNRNYGGSIVDLSSIWKEHISGPRVVILNSHEQAEESVRQTIASSSQMAVRLRAELLESSYLRKTTVGRQYVEMLKKRKRLLESGNRNRWEVWKKTQDPEVLVLETELRHWKKCKLPEECSRDCLFTE